MKASDIQLMMVVRGLYREGIRTITIKEMRKRILKEVVNYYNNKHVERGGGPVSFMGWDEKGNHKVAEWFKEANGVRRDSNIRIGWDVWNFSDRFRRAITRLAKTGRIKVEGEKKKGGYSINSKVHLWDYTVKQMFGKDALRFVVTSKV